MKSFRRAFSIALLLCILWAPAGKAASSRIESFLDMIGGSRISSFSLELKADIKKWPLYSEERLEKLNRLIRHFSFSTTSRSGFSRSVLSADGEPILSWEIQPGTETETQVCRFSTDPEQLYSVQTDQGGLSGFLSGNSSEMSGTGHYLRIREWSNAFYHFFDRITSLYPEETSSAAMQMKYKEFHTAVKKETLILTEEMTDSLKTRPEEIFPPGDEETMNYFSSLVFQGKQKIILQRDENGQLVRINYSGKAGANEESLRTVTIDWKILREDERETDQFQIKTPSVKGTARNNLTFKRTLVLSEGTEKWNLSLEEDIVENRIRSVIKADTEMVFSQNSLHGEIREKITSSGVTEENDLLYNLQNENSGQWEGTLEITKKTGKIETTRLNIDLRFQTGREVSGFPPFQGGNASAPETKPLSQEGVIGLKARIAETLLRKILTFPQDDLVFLAEDIPEEQWDDLAGK